MSTTIESNDGVCYGVREHVSRGQIILAVLIIFIIDIDFAQRGIIFIDAQDQRRKKQTQLIIN